MTGAPQTATQVAQHLLALARDHDRLTTELSRLDEAAVRARARYEVTFARAFLEGEGAVDSRKHAARLAVESEWLDTEIADQRVRSCREQLRSIGTRIEVGRSFGSAIKAEVSLAQSGVTP